MRWEDAVLGQVDKHAVQVGVGANGDDARAGGGIRVRQFERGPSDGPDPRIEGEKRGQ